MPWYLNFLACILGSFIFSMKELAMRGNILDFGMGHITTKTLSEMIKIGSIFETIWFQI